MESTEELNETIKYAGSQIAPIKCFLCDKNFMVGDESYLMFEKRLTENNEEDASMASVLSSAIGKEISEATAHSKVLCHSCNEFVLEYELIEQRYIQLKYKLIKDYNKIAQKYGTEIVSFEILESEIDNVIDSKNIENQHIQTENKSEYSSLQKNDIFEYLLDKSFITENTNIIDKEEVSNFSRNSKDDMIKMENNFVEEIEECRVVNEDLNSLDTKNSIEISSEDVHFDQIVEQSQFSNDENTLDNDDSTSFQFITEDNSSLKSGDCNNFELDLSSKKINSIDDPQNSFLFDGENFTCLLCHNENDEATSTFDSKTITTHMKESHDISLFFCYFCGSDFSKKSLLFEHVKNSKCNTQDIEYQCDICKKIFANLRSFSSHKRTHQKSYECEICKKKFSTQKSLDEHLNTHEGARPYNCNVCCKDFASKYTLNSHMKIHFDRERLYPCEICNKSFLTSANLQQHRRTHSSVKEYTCDVCQKGFATQHNLEVHKIIHTGHKPFLCRTCGKSFARRAEITDHERTHTGEKPFECDLCGMRFAQRSNLSTHKKSTHFNEKKHKCETCGKSFKRKRLLDYHVQAAHTGERPYKCELCHSSFVYPEHYKKHLRIHSGVKPYSCEVCGKSFYSRDNRNAHRFIHSDKKPYECLTCGQGFMRKPLLYNHMQSVGHINDTIIVNQPRIKQTDEVESDNPEIQMVQENSDFKIVIDARQILMDDYEDEMDEIVLEEEHLIDGMDGLDSNNKQLDENEEILGDL